MFNNILAVLRVFSCTGERSRAAFWYLYIFLLICYTVLFIHSLSLCGIELFSTKVDFADLVFPPMEFFPTKRANLNTSSALLIIGLFLARMPFIPLAVQRMHNLGKTGRIVKYWVILDALLNFLLIFSRSAPNDEQAMIPIILGACILPLFLILTLIMLILFTKNRDNVNEWPATLAIVILPMFLIYIIVDIIMTLIDIECEDMLGFTLIIGIIGACIYLAITRIVAKPMELLAKAHFGYVSRILATPYSPPPLQPTTHRIVCESILFIALGILGCYLSIFHTP